MSVDNVVGAECHRHLVRMPRSLLVNAVNQVHGTPGVMALELRLDPDGEKLGAQVTLLDLAQIDVSLIDRSVLADIKIFVEEALRRISVGIDDERGLVNGLRRFRLTFGRSCGFS